MCVLSVVASWLHELSKTERAFNGWCRGFDSKANFVTFKPKVNANRVFKGLLDKGVLVKNLGNLPVIGHCLRVAVGLPSMDEKFLHALRQVFDEIELVYNTILGDILWVGFAAF